MSRRLGFVLGLASLVLAGACAGAPEGESSGDGGGLVFAVDDVSLLVSGPADGASDANYPGELAVVDGCLGIEIGGAGRVVVWPEGTVAAEGDEPGIVTPDGDEVSLGTSVQGGGGSVAPDELPSSAPEIPSSCADTEEVVVLGTVEVS